MDILVFTEKILLYAGNFWLGSPLVLIAFGKVYLYFTEQSAGNFGFSTNAQAVTKNTYMKYSELPKISEHVPKYPKFNDEEFGYFLAGLIEGDGWFGKKELHIIFSETDISLAYFIKERIGHGNVYKIKDKKAVRYICKNKEGLFIILSLINGKLVSNYKYDQLIKHNYSEDFNINIMPPLNNLSLDNSWLAGFTQADGCFHISVVKSKTHKSGYSVRLEFSLKQNDELPLRLLYNNLGMGNISQYHTGVWCYKSSGYKTAAVLINYFDKYNVFAGKYVDYLKFRKVYIMITEGKHLDSKGILKIQRTSKSMLASHWEDTVAIKSLYSCTLSSELIIGVLKFFNIYLSLEIIFVIFIDYIYIIKTNIKSNFIKDTWFHSTVVKYALNKNKYSLSRRKLNTKGSFWVRCTLLGRRYFSSKSETPRLYENADTQRLIVLKENKDKSGVYLWTNNINGKNYVGSSTNLSRRFLQYYNTNHLLKFINMNICKALLKYGYSNFSITILEFCDKDDCLKKEQQYIDLLSPEYNILKIAGSSTGYIHTDEAKAKISAANTGLNVGRTRSPETIAKFISSLDGIWPMEGKKHSEETRKKCQKLNKEKNTQCLIKL